MKLYEVTNGYGGDSYVRVYVIAESKERALELAKEKYLSGSKGYADTYYKNLRAELFSDDTTKEFISEIMD